VHQSGRWGASFCFTESEGPADQQWGAECVEDHDYCASPQTQAVTWDGVINAATGANGALTMNECKSGWCEARAYSTQTFTGDVTLDFTVRAYSNTIVGLTVGNGDNSYPDIDCAFNCDDGGWLSVYERGSWGGSHGQINTSTKLSVSRVGSTVTFWKDGVLERTCKHALNGSVLAGSNILMSGGILTASFTAPTTSLGMSA